MSGQIWTMLYPVVLMSNKAYVHVLVRWVHVERLVLKWRLYTIAHPISVFRRRSGTDVVRIAAVNLVAWLRNALCRVAKDTIVNNRSMNSIAEASSVLFVSSLNRILYKMKIISWEYHNPTEYFLRLLRIAYPSCHAVVRKKRKHYGEVQGYSDGVINKSSDDTIELESK